MFSEITRAIETKKQLKDTGNTKMSVLKERQFCWKFIMADFTTYNYPACLIVGCYYNPIHICHTLHHSPWHSNHDHHAIFVTKNHPFLHRRVKRFSKSMKMATASFTKTWLWGQRGCLNSLVIKTYMEHPLPLAGGDPICNLHFWHSGDLKNVTIHVWGKVPKNVL